MARSLEERWAKVKYWQAWFDEQFPNGCKCWHSFMREATYYLVARIMVVDAPEEMDGDVIQIFLADMNWMPIEYVIDAADMDMVSENPTPLIWRARNLEMVRGLQVICFSDFLGDAQIAELKEFRDNVPCFSEANVGREIRVWANDNGVDIEALDRRL